tara:strand:+ start:4227 stop:4397 length:171 start_codon:yes stop_codon:yes gene_type:complete
LGIVSGIAALLGLATANALLKGAIAASVRILACLDPLGIEIDLASRGSGTLLPSSL